MWQLARRPRWIAALVLCLAIAFGFAALGQWQLSRSVDAGVPVDETTETPVPLAELAVAQQPLTAEAAGRRVTIEGTLVPGDFTVLSGRLNDRTPGYWVVAHLVATDDATNEASAGASLAVALGWAATEEDAASAVSDFDDRAKRDQAPTDFGGRYLPSEAPQEDDFENGEQNSLSTAALVNQWVEAPTTVYAGYLVTDEATPGLDLIEAPAPSTEISINWLNIFYAVEWAVFAGFAVFLWFRLVKDAWEREQEEAEELRLVN
ncbi:SURF1 family protein [Conyzicola sp.]|uniref:SURF1 family protein n=1 Tax=Conyzicola sp. TaxID=1969404 RepID=UPI003988DA77